MELSAVSNVKQQNFKGNTKSVSSQEKTPQQIKNGKKKLALAAAGAATVAIVAIAIAAKMKSGKPVDGKGVQNLANGVQQAAEEITQGAGNKLANGVQQAAEEVAQGAGNKLANGVQQAAEEVSQTAEEKLANRTQELVEQFNQEAGVKLNQIKFNKGTAYTKDGATFEGNIIDTLKNGDKVKLTYVDGKIQSSTRIGKENLIKEFDSNAYHHKDLHRDVIKKDLFGNEISKIEYLDSGLYNEEKAYVKTFATGEEFKRKFDGKNEYHKFTDGSKSYYYDNGNISTHYFADGTKKCWDESGTLIYHNFADGTEKHWDEAGNLIFETTVGNLK